MKIPGMPRRKILVISWAEEIKSSALFLFGQKVQTYIYKISNFMKVKI